MADNTPVEEVIPSISEQKAELQPDATKAEVEVPTFAKSAEQLAKEPAVEPTEASPEVPNAEVAPAPETEDAILKKRLSGAITEVEKKNEEVRRYIEMQSDIVRENNDLIHKIAASDLNAANQVVVKVWGTQGIRSYKQLLERSKLEELKTQDPQAYETKRELYEIKSKLAEREQKEQVGLRSQFLKEKGIAESDYDPNYRKIMEAMDTLNPQVVSNDYQKALKLSFAIAFAEERPVPKSIEVPTVPIGGGSRPAPMPAAAPQVSSQTSWLADQLNKKRGYNIKL